MRYILFMGLICLSGLISCNSDDAINENLELINAYAGSIELNISGTTTENVPNDRPISLIFSAPLNPDTFNEGINLLENGQPVSNTINLGSKNNTANITTIGVLEENTEYTVEITNQLKSSNGTSAEPIIFTFKTTPAELELLSASINGMNAISSGRISNVDNDDFLFTVNFSTSVDIASFQQALNFAGANPVITSEDNNRTLHVRTSSPLNFLHQYEIAIDEQLLSTDGNTFDGFTVEFYTQVDSTYKFPVISDEELLTKVQEQTFKYFWDFGHPNSGLARERNTSGDLVTIGGSGFGVMAILVGIERGFITRQEGVNRLEKIVNFLSTADRFHGVWPHWMNGNTGDIIPFSSNDNGGDLVETAFMIQGLLTVREYLNSSVPQENSIKNTITTLWEEVEWDWYTRDGQNVLYWHWSPDKGWAMNHKISGWNEALIIYVLAASSPTHPIDASVYHEGWARNGAIKNGNSYYGVELPLGNAYGGPLFFAHYSFLGLDPRNLEDQYANYWEQNVNHSLINQKHAEANPNNYVGYGENAWGFTASDNHENYNAHSPTNDKGVITPTAALSSFPYTPEQSLDALHHFYYLMGDKLWGEYGFKDAYNPTEMWYANSYLAIDQGPIIVMIENYRTGLLWNLFMDNPEITNGLTKLGFTYE